MFRPPSARYAKARVCVNTMPVRGSLLGHVGDGLGLVRSARVHRQRAACVRASLSDDCGHCCRSELVQFVQSAVDGLLGVRAGECKCSFVGSSDLSPALRGPLPIAGERERVRFCGQVGGELVADAGPASPAGQLADVPGCLAFQRKLEGRLGGRLDLGLSAFQPQNLRFRCGYEANRLQLPGRSG